MIFVSMNYSSQEKFNEDIFFFYKHYRKSKLMSSCFLYSINFYFQEWFLNVLKCLGISKWFFEASLYHVLKVFSIKKKPEICVFRIQELGP